MYERSLPGTEVPDAMVMTFEGEARSGKGTSVRAVRAALEAEGYEVTIIDQGIKFRALAKIGVDQGVDLDNDDAITDFLQAEDTQPAMLDLLARVRTMTKEEVDDLLYTPDIGAGSGKIGNNSIVHPIVISILFAEVERAIEDGADIVLIDGRCMEKYGRQMTERKIAQYVMGFYFRCDTSIAGRRTSGIFIDMDHMCDEDKLRLLSEITRASDRNKSDAQREVDPMVEPAGAYTLRPAEFDHSSPERVREAALEIVNGTGMVSMDTSYTRSVEEMTNPVVVLALEVLNVRKELYRV